LNFFGKIKQAHGVRNRRAAFSHLLSHLFLSKTELFAQALERNRFFYWVQILALNIFDKCYFELYLLN
jgi:hypothetical protein